MTIRTVSKSDEGLYHCKHPERGESPQSWISVRGSQQNNTQTSAQNQRESGTEDSQCLYTTLQADAGAGSMDVTYAEIELKVVKKPKRKGEKAGVNENTVYSDLKHNTHKDAGAGSMDVTYAEIELKAVKKPKRKREKTGVTDDTVYSNLKPNTRKEPGGRLYTANSITDTRQTRVAQIQVAPANMLQATVVNLYQRYDKAVVIATLLNPVLPASPRPTLTVHPESPVFTGESVTLKCEINPHDGWTYQWHKQSKQGKWAAVYQSENYTVNRGNLTIRGDAVTDGDQYFCKVKRPDNPSSTQISNTVTLTVQASPRPTLTVEPESPLFPGESVTLKCGINPHGGWTYQWYKQIKLSGWAAVHQSENYTVNRGNLTIRGDAVTDGDQYYCKVKRPDNPSSTQISNTVTLTVLASPRATLTVEPESPLFPGESVTLKCEIQSYSNWRYQWYKGSSGTAVSQSQTNTYTIRSAADQDQYWCRGERDIRPTSSQDSNRVSLSVGRPKPELISSHKGAALIGSLVVLYCKLDQSAGWKFYWSKHTQNPENETETETPSYTISSVSVSDGGQYWCRAGRGDPVYYSHYSDALWINTTGGAVILESPVHPVPEGDPLTLRCLYRHTKPSNLTVEFYKDGSLLQTQTTGEMTIRTVSKSDDGLYHCKLPKRGESPQSWISVRGASFSVFSLLSSLMAVSPYLLVSIVLGFKCYRAQASPRPTLTVHPESPVFTGESVTLKCEINPHGGWTYQWYKQSKQGKWAAVYQSENYTVNRDTVTIRGDAVTDGDQYYCKVKRPDNPSSTQISNTVTLTVQGKLKPELTSSHKGAALIGSPVVLHCKLNQSARWKFYWSKHTQNPENETETETPSYTISSVSVSDRGEYWCRAGRGDPVYYTHYSDALWINTTGESPPVSLRVSPSRTQHFTTDPLSLSCEGQSDSTGWRVRRYTHSEKVSDCSSGWGSATGSTCSISSLSPFHTGVYWCESESGESSNPVNITVHSESTCSAKHQQNNNQTADQNQRESGGEPADEPSDVHLLTGQDKKQEIQEQ
ncbi:hypothetical protein NFI96_024975, partial [Prochilodus magdalenae]